MACARRISYAISHPWPRWRARPHGRPASLRCSWRSTSPATPPVPPVIAAWRFHAPTRLPLPLRRPRRRGLAVNPDPGPGRKRSALQRQSFNLVTAFDTHRQSVLRFMYDLDVGATNNQAERDLRPVKLHRKISSCFRGQAGVTRFANVRSYLSTTRKNDVGALDALTRLFNGDPWMPPQAA